MGSDIDDGDIMYQQNVGGLAVAQQSLLPAVEDPKLFSVQ
jgi:hypothetical protein